MWFINRTLMQKLIYNELNKVEDTRIKHVSEYKFLDRYGEIGEYMRLELKVYCYATRFVSVRSIPSPV